MAEEKDKEDELLDVDLTGNTLIFKLNSVQYRNRIKTVVDLEDSPLTEYVTSIEILGLDGDWYKLTASTRSPAEFTEIDRFLDNQVIDFMRLQSLSLTLTKFFKWLFS